MRALLIGFGDLAQRLAPLLIGSGAEVAGLRRSPGAFPGVDLLQGDCRDPDVLLSALEGKDLVVVTLTPGAFTEQAYRDSYVAGARALAQALKTVSPGPRQVLWVSSTSVYGKGDGDWVDETSPAEPGAFSGRCLLEAEQMVLASPCPATVVRFSGIYGPGSRRMLNLVRDGQCAPAEPVQWTNRIHRDDCAGVLHHLAMVAMSGQPLDAIYLGTDCEPVPLHDVHRWLAQRLGVAFTEKSGAGGNRGNRRCSNRRLLDSGYRFIYPTFREGYGAMVAEDAAIPDPPR